MVLLKTAGIFVLAALGELGGTYLIWRWLREGATPVFAFLGVVALFGYAVVQTLQPQNAYGRIYAAYAGVFLIGALLWGWLIDGKAPDRFDLIGAAVVLVGVTIIMWGRQLFT
jgi:small multidrug resistance family-3 protein